MTVMESREELLTRKIDNLIEDNTNQVIEINNLTHLINEKEYELKKITEYYQDEREINVVVRDCVLRFSHESSLTGLISVCSEYLMHYYKPSILTFYISNNAMQQTDTVESYSHIYDFKTRKDFYTTKPTELEKIFSQMITSQQITKKFSSLDLARLEEERTVEAVIYKVQYSNKVIGFLLMEYVEENNYKTDNLSNLLLEIFANNYSTLVITNLLAERYDNALSQASFDIKTGIANSRQFMSDIEELGSTDYCILAIDVDDFKHVNDNYGHDSGDEVLRFVGQTINEYMARLNGKGYREGGDEFLGISLASLTETQNAVKELLEEIANHEFEDTRGNTFYVSNSAGLYQRQHGETLSIVKKKVDILLYSSKQKGKKNYTADQNVKID